jgi:hypothetical protein
MTMTRRALAVGTSIALGLVFAACGDTERDASTGPSSFSMGGSGGYTGEGGADAVDSAAPPLEICDGSPGLRLASGLVRCGGWDEPGQLFIRELGWRYLFVNGQCHYWAWWTRDAPHNRWYPTREGQLSPEDAAALASDVRYSSWDELVPWPYSDCSDCCTHVLHDQTRAFRCYGNCGVSLAQGDDLLKAQEAFAAIQAAWDWTARLYDAGTPVDGPMRILVTELGLPDTVTSVPWPLAEPIEGFVVTGSGDPLAAPPSFLITDPGEIQILRQLRQDLINDQLGNDGDDHIIIESQGTIPPWVLYMRDTVPLEDATGHVPEP